MSLCCPSRVTVQTGDYAHNTGVLGNTPPQGGYGVVQRQERPAGLAAVRRATGRSTSARCRTDSAPNATRPTSLRAGGRSPAARGPGEFYGFIGPPSSYTDFALDENGTVKTYTPDDYSTDVYADLAVDRIDHHFTNLPNDPLYMQVQFFAPHDPATPAPQYQNAFATTPLPIDASFNEKNVKDKPAWIRQISALRSRADREDPDPLPAPPRDPALGRRRRREDRQRALATGQLDNTYLIFTSDNGFMQGQHRLHQGKFAPYEPSIQVPLLIRGPGIPAGSQPRALVWNGDITSTILQITGAQPGLPQDGRSLLPYARDPNLPTRLARS